MAVFVTGATGFLGRYLAQGLLDEGEELVLLVRGTSPDHAEQRARSALAWMRHGADELVGTRVRVVVGDLDRPGLGLTSEDRRLVVDRCESFLHCGASVQFDLPIAQARAINVGGTQAILDLARERRRVGALQRIDHVSTAYVAGHRTDRVLEDELDATLGHRNTYERTKFESEQLLRRHQDELPIAVHRPSIVVGESDFGRTPTFNVLYWPMRAYARGYLRVMPARWTTSIDIVPVDFVRDAMLHLRRQPESLGGTFHLAAGAEGAMTVRDIVALGQEYFPDRTALRVVDPAWWMRTVHPVVKRLTFGRVRRALETVELYVPYARSNPTFDTARTRAALAGTGIAVPEVKTYFGRLVEYCLRTDWGRLDPGESDPSAVTAPH